MIVLDASAAVEWLLQSSAGQRIECRIYSRNESLHAPHLLDVQVSRVLRRLVRDKIVAEDRAGEAIEDLRDLRVARYPHSVMLPRITPHAIGLRRCLRRACRSARCSAADLRCADRFRFGTPCEGGSGVRQTVGRRPGLGVGV